MNEVTYLGRTICCDDFRAWIYGKNDTTKLVNSWDEFQEHINSGKWYASKEDLERESAPKPTEPVEVIVVKPRTKKRR
jgi:hypothetical protein